MSYSVHSHTEYLVVDTIKEAEEIAQSMAEAFGSAYIINEETNEVIDEY
jgi:hypothetical protein